MPELPEVETIKTGLSKLIIGKKIISLESNWSKSFPNSQKDTDRFLIGSSITNIRRRGKVLIIELDSKYALLIHLKMTGQLVYRDRDFAFGAGHPTDSLIGVLPDKSTRVTFEFADGGRLFFNDQRKFGWVRLIPVIEIANIDFFKKIGPEPLDDKLDTDTFINHLNRRKNSSIKSVLLDQTIIAGIGNIYADEALWQAKIHPKTLVKDISPPHLKKLFEDIRLVLDLSIKNGGSTDRNYINAEGERGSYLRFANVFRRQNQPCSRCQELIQKIRVAGRGTHICPNCQKLPKTKGKT